MLGKSLGNFSIQSLRVLSGCWNTQTSCYSLGYLGGLYVGNGGVDGSYTAGAQGHWGTTSAHNELGEMRWELWSSAGSTLG